MKFLKTLAAAAALAVIGSSASAVTTVPFDTPLSAGDATNGAAVASAFESFGTTQFSFSAATDLMATIQYTINPFLMDLSGNPSNTIALSYSVNGGAAVALAISSINTGFGFIGAGGVSQALAAGDVFSVFITGNAGRSGNWVTFAVETAEIAPVPLPATGLLLIFALGGGAVVARRRKTT